jgi:F-type H+-transporting ATPase subunit epsilon
MAHPFDIEVVAADRRVFTGAAISVTIPGLAGYFGVLHGHAPLVAALKPGALTIDREGGEPLVLAVSGGFVEVMADRVLVLADSAELVAEIDVERARLAKERAQERIRVGGPAVDLDRAQAALLRAIARLKAAAEPHI